MSIPEIVYMRDSGYRSGLVQLLQIRRVTINSAIALATNPRAILLQTKLSIVR